MLAERNILFAPDFVLNSGGVISGLEAASNMPGRKQVKFAPLEERLEAIRDRLGEIFRRSRGQIWVASLSSAEAPAQLIHDRGKCGSLVFSPDGKRLAFVSARTDHAFIGLYDFSKHSITWLSPSVDEDDAIAWSPDSRQLAFIRSPSDNPYRFVPRLTGIPWSIWVADATDGTAKQIWIADAGIGSVFSAIDSAHQQLWTASGNIIFP